MATNSDFSLYSREDCTLTISMTPPTAIGGWGIEFRMQRYFGDTQSGGLLKSVASGFSGASGITITNSGQGIFAVDLQAGNTSGLPFGNYAYTAERVDAGQKTVLSIGYALIGPDIG
jgi:hypothetical protein